MEDLFASVKNDLKNKNAAAAAARIQEYLGKNNDIPLSIAITGEYGAGKTTFVNAFGERKNQNEQAGVKVSVVTTYLHPEYPDVELWDLPGIGSTRFPADTYLELVGFEKFDFFIIISDTRFRENDVKLAKEIQKMKKKFYFVRSKTDNNIRAAQRKKDFSEEWSLTQMREDCVQRLKGLGIESPQVFLVSSFDHHLYDFPHLQQTFTRDLPEIKTNALLLQLHNISWKINNKKKEAFQTKIKYYTLLCAAVAALPLPGISAVVDLSVMAAAVRGCVQGFGLDKLSLKRLAANSGVLYTDLCDVIKSPLAGVKLDKKVIMKLLIRFTVTAAIISVKERLKSTKIFGILAAVTFSYITSYTHLMFSLNEFADDAQRVFERAVGLIL